MTEDQISEMFRLMTNSIKDINELKTKIDGLENKFDGLETKFDEAEEKNENFRQQTNQNFDEVNQKLHFMNTRTEVLIEDLMQTKVRVKDVEKRVDVLERKDAA